MLIKWNGDGLLGLPVIDGNLKTTLVGQDEIIVIMPGWNEIEDDKWNIIATHVEDKLASGKLEMQGTKEIDKETKAISYVGKALRDVRADIARTIVQECYNKSVLESWTNDARLSSEVRYLVDKQIEYCLAGKGPEDKKR